MRCRPADLSVFLAAINKGNIPKIVTAIGPHDGSGDVVLKLEEEVWLEQASAPLT